VRVLIATNSRDRGSTSRTLESWVRLLPQSGIDPWVTVGGEGPLDAALRAAGIPTARRRLRVWPRKSWPIPFMTAVARLALTVRRSGAALVHVNEHDHHLVASRAARLAGVPILTHLRFRPEPDYCAWLFAPPYTPRRLFFTSHTQMRDCAPAVEPSVPRDRWRILPNGLDLSSFGHPGEHRQRLRNAWRLTPDAIALGTACAISARKRVDHFITLIDRLRRAGVPAHGFIAGEPVFDHDRPLVDKLKALAVSLGLAEYITFLGYVEPSEPLYHAWDICISTSSYETFGMTVLEAMACRCAVVAYPGGSVQEIAGPGARIVPDGDEECLFRETLRFCQDDQVRREVGQAGREHAERMYDIRRVDPTLAQEYRDVIQDRSIVNR